MAGAFDVLADSDVVDAAVALKMKKAVGFRNVAVHNYQAVDWEIVFNICHRQLSDFRDCAAAVAHYVGL